ncbi:uncharacterized protein K460DRAFT_53070 [Cucurbitaria berberidis CBS 394.84]|uniref:Uncharacterized protein n=1 Tax=Cucurbitaria berberidis CBS 394.84 TaxID=1168544 RepID=A0A9P4GL42_9PLEO|nr:uncharacterized protein K460DRAFT_53070 [Cucurbitaria berberidis CBS 394.84]KAF1847076.1 hypothetical protein K460DRAFT_53070 [Cucurbitaria berberidis CBS 394.84]
MSGVTSDRQAADQHQAFRQQNIAATPTTTTTTTTTTTFPATSARTLDRLLAPLLRPRKPSSVVYPNRHRSLLRSIARSTAHVYPRTKSTVSRSCIFQSSYRR